jgi:prepilin-type N-terminal cleavage/methylation domain-containing protein
MRQSGKGFSLVELIATIIVIVALSAILMSRYGGVSNAARNAVIQNLLKDSRAIYTQLNYGSSANGHEAITTPVRWGDYQAGGTLGNVTVQLNGNLLTLSNIPADLFKNHQTTLQINYQAAPTYNGQEEVAFLRSVSW